MVDYVDGLNIDTMIRYAGIGALLHLRLIENPVHH